MTWDEKTNCPDCEGDLKRIKLIDATDRAMGGGVGHVELSYAAHGVGASHFTGTIPKEGLVKGMVCTSCGRIFLYADKLSL